MKIFVACSAGGHFTEAQKVVAPLLSIDKFDVYLVSYRDRRILEEKSFKGKFYLTHPQKKVFKTLRNLIESFILVWREKPDVVISTGADVALFVCILGKILGKKIVYIESGAFVFTKTLSGKIIYYFSDLFLVQWKPQKKLYPKAIWGGPLI